MAGKKKKIVTVTEEPDERENLDDGQIQELDGFFAEIGAGDDIRYKLYRIERTGKHVWLADGTPANFSEALIQEEHGAGDYLVRAVAGGKWIRSKMISIGAPAGGPRGNPSGNVELEMMKLRMELDAKASERFTQQSQTFQNALLQLMTAMIGSNKPQDLGSMVAIFRELNQGKDDLGKMRDMFGLFKEMNPGGSGDGDMMTSLITSVVPKLIPQRTGDNPPAPAPVAPAAPPAAPVAAQTQEEIMYAERMKFLKLLKEKATAGKDPGFWAEYIIENEDLEPSCKWILDLIEAFSWEVLYPGLLKIDPELSNEPFKTWFEKLYKELKEGENDADAKNNPQG